MIKLLHIHDCASWQQAQQNLEEALALLGVTEGFETVLMTTGSQSLAEDFGGSPTITRDGIDIFGHSDPIEDLACRIYFTPEGLRGSPSTDMILQALEKRPHQ
jgi:hypothetical protein